jgi:hypothetical protein
MVVKARQEQHQKAQEHHVEVDELSWAIMLGNLLRLISLFLSFATKRRWFHLFVQCDIDAGH